MFIQLINQHPIRLSFISETEKGAKGKIVGRPRETERERARESKHWEMADVASVVRQTVRKYTC